MRKIDFEREYGQLYFPPKGEIVTLKVPAMTFAMVDGAGDPNGSTEFREALEALFGVSYTLRFGLKAHKVAEYRVAPLEALWWNRPDGAFQPEDRTSWHWTSMILQPDVVTPTRFQTAVGDLRRKRNPAALGRVRLERFEEGWCAQTLHVGPYSSEAPTIRALHEHILAEGGRLRGKHHEIYLGDPRRSKPERLRTVIRQPFVN